MLVVIKTVHGVYKVEQFQALLPYLAWVSLPCITRLHKTRMRRSTKPNNVLCSNTKYSAREREYSRPGTRTPAPHLSDEYALAYWEYKFALPSRYFFSRATQVCAPKIKVLSAQKANSMPPLPWRAQYRNSRLRLACDCSKHSSELRSFSAEWLNGHCAGPTCFALSARPVTSK